MAGLADFRKQHPEYNDMSDNALGDALHAKFYSDMPKKDFDAKMGLGRTFGDAIAAVPGGAIKEIGDTASALGTSVGHAARGLMHDPMGYLPNKAAQIITAAPGAAMDAAGGAMQYMRNLSPPDMRGSAPALPGGDAANHPFLAMGAGDTAPMKQEIAEHPLRLVGDALMAAGMTGPGRALIGHGADLATAPVRRGVNALADLTPTNRAQNQLLKASKLNSNPNTIAALLEGKQPPAPGVSYSVAQATQNPDMAQLEQGSRGARLQATSWNQFDTSQNTAMFKALEGITDPATKKAIELARQLRDDATKYGRGAATNLADQYSMEPHSGPDWSKSREGYDAPNYSMETHGAPKPINQFSEPIRDTAQRELDGPRGIHPGVETVGNWTLKSVPETGATAERAYEVRKRLADTLNNRAGISMSDLDSSIKSSDVTARKLRDSIDDSLDRASGGLWKEYMTDFAAHSPTVKNLEALNGIRTDLAKKIEGGAVDGAGNPKLSRAYIKQIIERHAEDDFGPTMLPGSQAQLSDVLHTAQQIEAPLTNYRLSTTGGGGSNSIANAGLAIAGHAIPGLGRMGRIASTVSGIGADRGATMLAELLQNPRNAAAALRTAADREAARRALHSSGITPAALAAALHALPAQQQQQ